MHISIFDLFSIGIGPSSSHTVGPMRAARAFCLSLGDLLTQTQTVQIELFGSLAHTGKGHGTPKALLMGLCGEAPDQIDPNLIDDRVHAIEKTHQLALAGHHPITFIPSQHIIYHFKELLPQHSNGMRFSAFANNQQLLKQETYYSIGGGFIILESDANDAVAPKPITTAEPYPFANAATLLKHAENAHCSIAAIMLANEKTLRDEATIYANLKQIAHVMLNCIDHGCATKGTLPGGLAVKRRAPILFEKLTQKGTASSHEDVMNWINLFAMAVNEENAAGGRVVTAPTNGAAGIIPAVLKYYLTFCENANDDGIIEFLLTAGALASLYKKGASISGAEVGCQGEVGVASSMAAGALAAVLGGNIYQVENAAEIAMEHHLGMTCDPIGGLVQIPCIERNAMGSIKAVNAARLALMEDGIHHVSLDKVIATMRQTGKDMMTIYKETSQGGLAVNVTEC